MPNVDVLTTAEPDGWLQALGQCAHYDFYHLPQYHALAESAGEGAAHLLLYSEGECTIALPLLLRSLDDLPCGNPGETGWRDATSVYGYPGPVCSCREIPASVIRNFQAALQERLRELGVVALFSRLHPLITPLELLAGLGERQVTPTVSVDLTLPADEQRMRYRKSLKEGLNRLRRMGLQCLHDTHWSHLDDFMCIYRETMERVQAAERYFFPASYFERLRDDLGDYFHLFVCLQEGRVVAGGLFGACRGILQYHLGGTLNDALRLAPMRLVLDEARLWGTARGLRVFHLGGGVSSRPDDSLLYFKRGFSDRLHEFSVWRWVLLPDRYERLCEEKFRWDRRHQLLPAVPHFFPEYRCPTIPGIGTRPETEGP